MSDPRELESRVERLEAALHEIDSRLAKLEQRPVRERQAPAPVAPHPVAVEEEQSVLGLFGICVLVLGGAFVLRALTESNVLPRLGGAILGIAYAGFWIWNSDRLARNHRPRAALFYAVTAAVISFPLVWETTVRFQILPAIVAAIAVGILGLLFLWIAIRTHEQTLAWTGSLAAIAAAFAIGPSPAMLVTITIIGVATSVFAGGWEFAVWPAAIASNILALILIVVTRGPVAVAALVCFSVLWVVPIAFDHRRDVFLAVQTTVAILIGIGGATLLLTASAATASIIWCVIGLGAAVFARVKGMRSIAVQSVVWIVAASVAGGLLLSTFGAFVGDRGSVELTPAGLVAGAAAFFAFLFLNRQTERIVLLCIFLCMAFTGTVAVGLSIVANAALLRTALLAVSAALLALIGRVAGSREASILARVVLVIGGLKLLAEDLRVGSAAILVISFALYGAALLVVSRSGWAEGHESHSAASQDAATAAPRTNSV